MPNIDYLVLRKGLSGDDVHTGSPEDIISCITGNLWGEAWRVYGHKFFLAYEPGSDPVLSLGYFHFAATKPKRVGKSVGHILDALYEGIQADDARAGWSYHASGFDFSGRAPLSSNQDSEGV